MKKGDNIEDWYREELSNYHVEPDSDGWESLADNLDATTPITESNISEWYKKEVEKLEERPDYTVWEKISTKLDTATVWDKLIVSLGRYEQFIWWRNLALKGSAIFLLFSGAYLAYSNFYTTKEDEPTYANITDLKKKGSYLETSDIDENVNYDNTINPREVISKKNKNIKKSRYANINEEQRTGKYISSAVAIPNKSSVAEKIKDKYNAEENTLIASNEMPKIKSLFTDDLTFSEKEKHIQTTINKSKLTEKEISHLYRKGEFLVKKNKNKIVFNNKRFSAHFAFGVYARRIYVGLNGGLKKQDIISTIDNNSVLSSYKRENFLDFGNSLGATVGLIVSDKVNLETNVNLNSTSGYKRRFSNEEVAFEEDVNLNYATVSLLIKKMANKSTFDNKKYSTNLIGGVYGAYLTSSESKINGSTHDIYGYKKADFGVVVGFEQDRYVTKEFIITPGVRYNQGLFNIANDKSNYNSAINLSLEFNLSVKYIFLKKK